MFYPNSPAPPLPPPKPTSQDASRRGTPATVSTPQSATAFENGFQGPDLKGKGIASDSPGLIPTQPGVHHPIQQPNIPDPGEQWLPKFLEDKSKQDLAEILANPALLDALTHSPATIHPSLAAVHENLQDALTENMKMAARLEELEARLIHQRSSAQAQLLSTHALERQWRQKQSEMDMALTPFAPTSLYQQLNQGVQEQETVCQAMEDSFIEGDGAEASERETLEWVRKYREAKKLYYLRQERKERWNEHRVGGWR